MRAIERHRRAQVVERELVEQRHVGAGVECLAQFVERFDLDFDRHAWCRLRARVATAAAIEPAAMMWFSLIEDPVVETHAVIAAAAAAHGVLLRACAGPGIVLRVSSIRQRQCPRRAST